MGTHLNIISEAFLVNHTTKYFSTDNNIFGASTKFSHQPKSNPDTLPLTSSSPEFMDHKKSDLAKAVLSGSSYLLVDPHQGRREEEDSEDGLDFRHHNYMEMRKVSAKG